MTTQELKNKIEKVLGNSIRCLLPSYWWKNLFHSVADRIDEVETTITENVNDMVVKSLKEFEAKHPDIERNTLYYTTDENSALARSNVTKILMWELAAGSTTPEVLKPLHIAVPFITIGDEVSAYMIQSPMYALDIFTESILFADVPFEGNSNIYINVYTGVATLQPASSSGGGSVMFVTNPIGDLTEEQKQNNADAFLKVLEAEGAIDINIMVMFFIAKPNMVSVNDKGDLVLVAAGIDGGTSKYIFTPEGDVTIETVEPTSSGGVEIRELRINSNLSDEDKAYNIETVELYKEGKALVITPITYSQTSTDRTDRMAAPFFVDLHTGDSTKLATFRFLAPQIDETDPFGRGLIQEATVVISNDGSVSVTGGSFYDVAMSDTSTKAVQNKVIKKYIDDAIANVGGPSQSITITTWAELKTMRDSSVLIPGSFYRIVDYVTTTSQEDTNSAEHQFDVVLLAITSNSLLEEGWAAKHDGDVYFSENNSNLNSWKIGYCLDNDSEKFSWASENGTGIIYRMIDEFGNDCPYDFKNIQFKRKLVNGILDLENGLDSYVYTFNLYNGETNINEDYSLKEQCHDNIIKLDSLKPCFLSNNVFLNLSDYMNYCDCNSLAIYCLDNTFGDGCRYNKFNEGCSNNIFGQNCGYNIFDYSCYDNVFSECHSNIIQNNFATNKCGNSFYSNTVGAWCSNNWFGESFNNNVIGNGCCNNIFGENIDSLSSEVCGYHITGNIHDKVLPLEGAREYETKVSLNSNGEVKMYCEADLIS